MAHCVGINWSVPRYPEWQSPYMMRTRSVSANLSVFIMVLGSITNCLTILTLWTYRSLRPSTRIFMLITAITDFLGMPLMMFDGWFFLSYGYSLREVSRVLCKSYLSFGYVTIKMGLFCLFFVSVEQILLFARPLQPTTFLLSEKRGIVITLCGVFILSVIASCIHLGYERNANCECKFAGNTVISLAWHIYAVGLFILMNFHLVVCNLVLYVMNERRSRKVDDGHESSKNLNSPKSKRCSFSLAPIKIVMAIGVIQLVCFLPHATYKLTTDPYHGTGRKSKTVFINFQLQLLFYSRFSLNFPIFMATSKGFRQAFVKMSMRIKHTLKSTNQNA